MNKVIMSKELKNITITSTWEYKGHKIELKETSFDRNEWAYFVDEDYSEDYESIAAAECAVEEIVDGEREDLR